MCGIFSIYSLSETELARKTLNGLKALEYRGYDSWGILVVQKRGVWVRKGVGEISKVALPYRKGFISLGHTRWATHGKVSKKNSHPHSDCTGRFWVVHNGIVENYTQLKKELEKKGHAFLSDTDTEVIAHLAEEKSHLKLSDIALYLLNQIQGHNAFVLVDALKRRVVAGKTGSPLVLAESQDFILLSSDLPSLFPYVTKAFFLPEETVVTIEEGRVRVLGAKTGREIKVKPVKIEELQAKEKKEKHFYLQEAKEQKEILRRWAHLPGKDLERAVSEIKKARRVWIIGCGSSYFAGKTGEYLLSQALKRPVLCYPPSELLKREFLVKKGDLIIAISQSGETIDVLEAVRFFKKRGVKILGVVNIAGSSLYQIANTNILLRAGLERAVVATKTFTSQVALLWRLWGKLASKEKEARDLLLDSSDLLREVEEKRKVIKNWAKAFWKKKGVFVLSEGFFAPLGEEIALKIKETAWYPAFFTFSRELKHGPLALIDKDWAVLLLGTSENKEDILSTALEVKSRGGEVFALLDFEPGKEVDKAIGFPQKGFFFSSLYFGQLLAYEMALLQDRDPDKPRNLAKSVTVK